MEPIVIGNQIQGNAAKAVLAFAAIGFCVTIVAVADRVRDRRKAKDSTTK